MFTFRLRSPGSSLKPFAYAFAMERGMLHPNTIYTTIKICMEPGLLTTLAENLVATSMLKGSYLFT